MLNSNQAIQQKPKRNYSAVMLTIYVLLTVTGCYFVPSKLAGVLDKTGSQYLYYFLWIFILGKTLIVDRFLARSLPVYLLSKVVDTIIITFMIAGGMNVIAAALFALTIVESAFVLGAKGVKYTAVLGLVAYAEIIAFIIIDKYEITNMLLTFHLFLFVLLAIISYFSYRTAANKDKVVLENQKVRDELSALNEQLASENTDIRRQLGDFQFRNQKANKNLAELTTYQHVNKAINSTLNVKELLTIVNDMIIGILGVKYCTIFLVEDGPERLSVQGTNIKNEKLLQGLKEKIAIRTLDLIEKGHGVLASTIDPMSYPGAIERQVQSVDYVPIVKKGKILGLIIAEHAIERGLDDSIKKFIENIANQIGASIENAKLYDQMEKMATVDALTRVNNRMYFQQNYKKEFEKAKNNNYPMCAVMLDIDHFKRFNDTYGHDFGDEVLRSTAQTVKNNLDSKGMVARYGGEEFVIILKETDLEAGFAKAEELRKFIEGNIIKHNDKAVRVTVSMGVSEFPRIASNEKDLLKTADEALYKSKENGRNQVSKGVSLN